MEKLERIRPQVIRGYGSRIAGGCAAVRARGRRTCGRGGDPPWCAPSAGGPSAACASPERGRIYSPNFANVVNNLSGAVVQAQFEDAPDRVQVPFVVNRCGAGAGTGADGRLAGGSGR